MVSSELDQALSDAAAEVLESMFFTTLMEDSETSENAPARWISARLSFHGKPPGRFGVRIPQETARKIAASFLGLEEDAITGTQVGEVVCELANMLCGSVLSRLEKETRFELSQPEIEAPEAVCPADATACRALLLEEGPVKLWLQLERAA
jgi:CheY-specific phosphatase CheX